jgi:hypothetical protein
MSRLTIRQLLVAIVIGALFATLQGDAPFRALARLRSAQITRRS